MPDFKIYLSINLTPDKKAKVTEQNSPTFASELACTAFARHVRETSSQD